MKNVYIFILVVLITQLTFTQTMTVHKNDQSTVDFQLSQIDSITFTIADTEITYLVNDDFESYGTSIFPSSGGWYERYNGSGQNIIDDTYAHSGTKSFRLQGLSNWSATIENHNAGWQSNSSSMGYEVYYYANAGDHSMGFLDYNPVWGLSYGTIVFGADGNIYADSAGTSVLIMPYTFGQWFKVTVQVGNIAPYKFKVWINDVYKGEYTSPQSPNHSIIESYFHINAGHAGNFVWFDDVKVWYRQ